MICLGCRSAQLQPDGCVPHSVHPFVEAQQVKGLAYDLTTDLLRAHSEALKRGASVRVGRAGTNWISRRNDSVHRCIELDLPGYAQSIYGTCA